MAALFRRDLTRLHQEIAAFAAGEDLWRVAGGASNSAGHLTLHLEGNLREFVGRVLGGLPYQRNRPAEFHGPRQPQAELLVRIDGLIESIPGVVENLDENALSAPYPVPVLGVEVTTRQFLMHLYGHLSYHTGQVDYFRRILTGAGAVEFAGL